MNHSFDPHTDAEITSALRTLPEPPEHRADFWAQLDQELQAAEPATPRATGRTDEHTSGRIRFLLVAAAIVAVAGALGLAAINTGNNTVDVADTPAPTTPQPETTPPTTVSPTTSSSADGGNRYVSEIFRYDVAIPTDMRLEFGEERGVYAVNAEGPVNATLSLSNYFPGDDRTSGATEASTDETLVSQSTVEVPLYREENGVVTQSEATLAADQYVFDRGEFGERIARVFTFDDRTIVAEVTIDDAGLVASDTVSVLEGIRLQEGPIAAVTACSSSGLPALDAPSVLNDAQRARFDGIVEALITCDWALLEAQMDPGGFMASFGGGDAIEMWQNDERYASPILRAVYDHLAFPVGGNDEGATWPQGWDNPDGFDDTTIEALLASAYYDETSLEIWDETTYLGFRTGISEDGTWSYFIAGD